MTNHLNPPANESDDCARANQLGQLLSLVQQAQTLGNELGLKNILQPGLLKELVIAAFLGHQVISTKHDADACDPQDPTRLFEYLSCVQGGTFQMDRVFSRPADKRERSLQRIARNAKVYCAVFDERAPLKLVELYELDTQVVMQEATRQLDGSSNDIAHLSFSRRWVARHSKVLLCPAVGPG